MKIYTTLTTDDYLYRIDNDPSNADYENLMVCCTNCHKGLR
ncbi:MAG TPA: hypothetical protein VL854_11060 [Nitrososphaeraceae archaeon]|nr:hypothetical protein [Nitrososphaeraceae archaeon]